jgi:hypothetical protein
MRTRRIVAASVMAGSAVALPFAVFAATDASGGVVGAIVLGTALVAAAYVVWPQAPSEAEARHCRLEAIWREVRGSAPPTAAWPRYAAWAEAADGGQVELWEIVRAPDGGPEPSPYSSSVVARVDGEDIAAAAGAMEQLRTRLATKELEARLDHDRGRAAAQDAEEEAQLRRIDDEGAAAIAAGEQQARRELAAQEVTERAAQAAATARAIRRE